MFLPINFFNSFCCPLTGIQQGDLGGLTVRNMGKNIFVNVLFHRFFSPNAVLFLDFRIEPVLVHSNRNSALRYRMVCSYSISHGIALPVLTMIKSIVPEKSIVCNIVLPLTQKAHCRVHRFEPGPNSLTRQKHNGQCPKSSGIKAS